MNPKKKNSAENITPPDISVNDTMEEMEFQESYKHVMRPPIMNPQGIIPSQQNANPKPKRQPLHQQPRQAPQQRPQIPTQPQVRKPTKPKSKINPKNVHLHEYPNLDLNDNRASNDIFTYGMPENYTGNKHQIREAPGSQSNANRQGPRVVSQKKPASVKANVLKKMKQDPPGINVKRTGRGGRDNNKKISSIKSEISSLKDKLKSFENKIRK